VFVGGFAHRPNGDGIRWFLDEVFPLIRKEEPGCEISIVGSQMPEDIRKTTVAGVRPKGWMNDEELQQLVERAACTIAPLRFGAGIKGKVINAFVLGSPVVSTSVGLQGIENPASVAFVGDTAQEFADAALQCLRDPALAERKALAALDFLRQRYSREAFVRAFQAAIPELVAGAG
jgi:glycosyltransferase involved in cell wall biosynthesis